MLPIVGDLCWTKHNRTDRREVEHFSRKNSLERIPENSESGKRKKRARGTLSEKIRIPFSKTGSERQR